MQRNRRLATWTGAILGAFLALVLNSALAHAADSDDDDRPIVTEEFHHTFPLAATGRVSLENINGAVHISVWDRNEVKVDAVKRAHDEQRLKQAEIRVTAQQESIFIKTEYAERDWNWDNHSPASVEYTLTVPRQARLDDIKLINGELDLSGSAGEVTASCINGKLVARGLTGRAELSTINGKLDANFEGVKQPLGLSSVNGSVELTLPSDTKAEIEATTVHGGIDNDFGLHTNDHRFVGHDLQGELGGGGTHIRLNNVNGRIEIHHATDGRSISPAKDTGEREEGTV